MSTKRVVTTKEVTTCDGCGVNLPASERGDFWKQFTYGTITADLCGNCCALVHADLNEPISELVIKHLRESCSVDDPITCLKCGKTIDLSEVDAHRCQKRKEN